MAVKAGPWKNEQRKIDVLNIDTGENCWEYLELQRTNYSIPDETRLLSPNCSNEAKTIT